MQIIIPSKGRADTITTHLIFPSAKIVVIESEYEAYAKNVGADRLVTLPAGLSGLTDTRNFILDNWRHETIYMADDDAIGLGRNHIIGGGHLDDAAYEKNIIKDPQICEAIIKELAALAESGGAWLFGLKWCKDKHFSGFEPFKLSGFVGQGLGFVKNHKLTYDKRCTLYDDYDISLMNLYQKRFCVVDQRYWLNVVDTAVNPGGLSNERNQTRYEVCFKAMRKKWGSAVERRERNGRDGKRDMQYNYLIKLNLPF